MSILENAIDSIIVGVEDYNMNTKKRFISSTRNIYAGILLLFKYKLVELSPQGSDEVLIKKKLLPKINGADKLEWYGEGKKTVDTFQIKERFKSLDIEIDEQRLDKISRFRNDIEHYYTTESKEAIESLISDSFLIIRNFISMHLKKDPQELLGKATWDSLISISEVYKAEKKDCVKSLESIKWNSAILENAIIEYKCDKCGSDLMLYKKEEDEFVCKSCTCKYIEEEIVEKALVQNIHWWYKEDAELINCPDCDKTTYLVLEKKCQLCNLSIEDTCIRCGTEIEVDSLEFSYFESSSLCPYCINQAH